MQMGKISKNRVLNVCIDNRYGDLTSSRYGFETEETKILIARTRVSLRATLS